MKLFQIEYMVVVCKCGSISKAADKLMISRPAISRALKELEEEAGTKLFLRSASGISLTENGVLFYRKCEKVFDAVEELQDEMARMRTQASDSAKFNIRMGLSPAMLMTVFPKICEEFSLQHPDIVVEPIQLIPQQGAMLLMENELDMTIAVEFDPVSDALRSIQIGEAELMFCCSRNHPLSDREFVSVDDLADEPLALMQKNMMKGTLVQSIFEESGHTANIKFRTQQISVLQHMVKEGLCSTVQFNGMMGNGGEIVEIPFESKRMYPILVLWNDKVRHNKAFYEIMEYLRSPSFCESLGKQVDPGIGPLD